jgi:hypothetical protein
MDIWDDQHTMAILNGGHILVECNLQENTKIKKRTLQYQWDHEKLMFKELWVLRPDERKQLILNPHEEIGHFGEGCTLAEVNKQYLWHNRIEDVKSVVYTYK